MNISIYAFFLAALAQMLWVTLAGALSVRDNPAGGDNAKTYNLQDLYQNEDFFKQWWFFTGLDPTNGNVNYLGKHHAKSDGLAYVNWNDNTFILRVDSWSDVPAGGKRNSVRIHSNKAYTGGLFILDVLAMPVGCGTWPSFWSNGPNWPLGGEIDIIEGVNDQPHNQMTLHSGTKSPCTLNSTSSQGAFTGHPLGSNCYSNQTFDSGCSISDRDSRSFGHGFNAAQGGVFAFLWDTSVGMSMWHFARADVPPDIAVNNPTPASWGEPSGFWSAATCDIAANFYNHVLIFDTTICGGWAGDAYPKSGCPGTCKDMVANKTNFVDAKWVINYLAVYR